MAVWAWFGKAVPDGFGLMMEKQRRPADGRGHAVRRQGS
jgi:hypothetical protein